jgi:predicted phosphodiesterase
MRYLIISDIHANMTALDAALASAKGKWEQAVCLGDLVGYGPDPNEVIDCVRSLGAITIRGNHDKAVAGTENIDDFNPVARAAAMWTRERLRPENREFLQQLNKGPKTVNGFSIVHGSVYDEDEYVYAPELAVDDLKNALTPVTFFGHTHLQGGFSLHGEDVQSLHVAPVGARESSSITIDPATTYLLNPGSVGQPRDGNPRAGFAIADFESRTVEFWRIPYDIVRVQERMTQSGLPEPLILRLSFGR